jgi:hypothetical protein
MTKPKNPFGKFLGPDQITEAILEIEKIAKAENLSIALVGGIAMQFYGSDRLTKDIDIIAKRCPSCLQKGKNKKLTFGGEQTRLPKSGIEVDIIVRNDDFSELYDTARIRARQQGFPVPLVQPEHLFAMKMAANRPKDEADMLFLATSKGFSPKSTRLTIKRFLGPYAAEAFDAFLMEAEWRKKTGKL